VGPTRGTPDCAWQGIGTRDVIHSTLTRPLLPRARVVECFPFGNFLRGERNRRIDVGFDPCPKQFASTSTVASRYCRSSTCRGRRRTEGARVLALASERHHQWLIHHDAIPVTYGDGVAERIRTAAEGRIDAFIDTFGANYIELALQLGVQPQRINTIINWPAAQKYGTKAAGSMDASNAQVLAELAALLSQGRLEIPIARIYPLADVRQAFSELEERHTLGKIVLWCSAADPLPGR
jgi:hypothetical protein